MRRQAYTGRRKQFRSLLIFLVITTILLGLLIHMDRAIRPNLCAVCQSETKRYASALLAYTISDVLKNNNIQNNDFTQIFYDSNGSVTAVETNAVQVNALQATLLSAVQTRLDNCRDAMLNFSLGTATDVQILAEHGPHISVHLMPIGNASVILVSSVESVGINQASHTIYAEVTAEIQAAIPFSKTIVEVSFQYLIAETMILGNVPNTYLEFDGIN